MAPKKVDFKAELKQLYKPAENTIAEIEVPRMNYLCIDGKGDPNCEASYREAVEALYALSYGLKFAVKKQADGFDYTVMPLEGLWWTEDNRPFDINNKQDLSWTAMIMQPPQVTPALFEQVRAEVAKKKKLPALAKVRMESYSEGKAVQLTHVGPYSEEPPSVDKLHRFIEQHGYHKSGKHHEIYLGNPAQTEPAKLKTIIRQPVA